MLQKTLRSVAEDRLLRNMSCASTSSHEAMDPARLTRPRDVDLTDYFSTEVVRKMPAIERTMYANKVRNYWMLEDLGESQFAILGQFV